MSCMVLPTTASRSDHSHDYTSQILVACYLCAKAFKPTRRQPIKGMHFCPTCKALYLSDRDTEKTDPAIIYLGKQ